VSASLEGCCSCLAGCGVSCPATRLDNSPHLDYICHRIISPEKGRCRGGKPRRRGERRSPRAGLHPAPRAIRASCLPALRPACGVRRWKWLRRRRSDPRPLNGSATKPGPDRTKGPHTPWEEPWWNAGRRTVPCQFGDGAALQKSAEVVAQRPFRRSIFLFVMARTEQTKRSGEGGHRDWICFAAARHDAGETGKANRDREATTPRGFLCPRFALHVAEIGCPAGEGVLRERVVFTVTLRRPRSGPRRATARAPRPSPSRRAVGAHLRMTACNESETASETPLPPRNSAVHPPRSRWTG